MLNQFLTYSYAQIPGSVTVDMALTDGEYRLYVLIVNLCGSDNHIWYTQASLAQLLECSSRTIRNRCNSLEAKGYLEIVRCGYHNANKMYPLKKVIHNSGEVIHNVSTIGENSQDRKVRTQDRKAFTPKSYPNNNKQLKKAFPPNFKNLSQKKPAWEGKGYLPGWVKIKGKWVETPR